MSDPTAAEALVLLDELLTLAAGSCAGTIEVESGDLAVVIVRDVRPAAAELSEPMAARRTVATVERRTQFSGVTGLTPTALSDGFRDLYRFTDGRALFIIEYPDLTNGVQLMPGGTPGARFTIRGVKGQAYATESTSMPLIVGWVADGMQYQVGGAGFTADELLRFAEALR